jgi:hypothetical protein
MGTMLEPRDRDPGDWDFIAKITTLIQSAIASWPRTLRLCLILAAIALVITAWNSRVLRGVAGHISPHYCNHQDMGAKACPIGRSTTGTHGHSRTARYTGPPAYGQADPLRKPTI